MQVDVARDLLAKDDKMLEAVKEWKVKQIVVITWCNFFATDTRIGGAENMPKYFLVHLSSFMLINVPIELFQESSD